MIVLVLVIAVCVMRQDEKLAEIVSEKQMRVEEVKHEKEELQRRIAAKKNEILPLMRTLMILKRQMLANGFPVPASLPYPCDKYNNRFLGCANQYCCNPHVCSWCYKPHPRFEC